ncbi:hypothetical protein, partial [Aeromonas jandaei]|uniref:hypothetical protein n=1 Tax=Aeromonas jandaei TaxID=650 RepID=UPI003BA23783
FLGIFAVVMFFVTHHQTPKMLPRQLVPQGSQHVIRIINFSTLYAMASDHHQTQHTPHMRPDPASFSVS